MPDSDLTPSQTAELLHVDSSTLRRWARAWSVHLSPQGQAKRRRFTADDLATFARGQQLLRAGRSPVEVAALLAVSPTVAADVPAVAVVSVPALARDLADAREGIRQLAEELKMTREAQAQGRAAIEETRQKVADLEARLQAWEAQGFFARLLGRKPKA